MVTKPNYRQDIQLELKLSRYIKQILGLHFFKKDIRADMQEGTDFLVVSIEPVKIALRLRRFEYFRRYPDEFTIRWKRPSGVKTEIDKIREGLVDFMLYGFVDKEEEKIIQYFIGDLEIFRICEPNPVCIKPNDPPDSELAAFKITQFPKSFIEKYWIDPEFKVILQENNQIDREKLRKYFMPWLTEKVFERSLKC